MFQTCFRFFYIIVTYKSKSSGCLKALKEDANAFLSMSVIQKQNYYFSLFFKVMKHLKKREKKENPESLICDEEIS